MEKTILVADDYEDDRMLTKFILESYGYKIIGAFNGKNAVEMFKLHSPDLILMDLAMPELDGLSATETIRLLDNGKDIPIFAVTAHGKHFYEKVIAAGCSGLIEKPVDFNLLIDTISRYFEA